MAENNTSDTVNQVVLDVAQGLNSKLQVDENTPIGRNGLKLKLDDAVIGQLIISINQGLEQKGLLPIAVPADAAKWKKVGDIQKSVNQAELAALDDHMDSLFANMHENVVMMRRRLKQRHQLRN